MDWTLKPPLALDFLPMGFVIYCLLTLSNRPRSIYQYSNVALRLFGQTSIKYLVLFSLYSSLLWELRH